MLFIKRHVLRRLQRVMGSTIKQMQALKTLDKRSLDVANAAH
ncbi:MAG TPA: hypothetical protein PLB55_23815 [Prosthecobacter sp.]|nr:hypothetical protein [Prosthecobacter sp.]